MAKKSKQETVGIFDLSRDQPFPTNQKYLIKHQLKALELRAFVEAKRAHKNCDYDYHPYEVHLLAAYDVFLEFSSKVYGFHDCEIGAAVLLHDTLEDTDLSYRSILVGFGKEVAEIVYACTTGKGRTRKERFCDEYYLGIRNTPNATFVKLCDRIANVLYSKQNSSEKFEMYKKEHYEFCAMLYDEQYDCMFDFLEQALYD